MSRSHYSAKDVPPPSVFNRAKLLTDVLAMNDMEVLRVIAQQWGVPVTDETSYRELVPLLAQHAQSETSKRFRAHEEGRDTA